MDRKAKLALGAGVVLAVVWAIAFAWSAAAQQAVTLTWNNPTTNTDGSAIGTIQSTRIERGTCGGTASNPTFGAKQGEWTQSGNAATSQSPSLPAGTHCFRAYTTTANGESGPSNVARKVILALPNPPTNLTVAADTTAWTIVTTEGAVVALEVGQVEPGTACDTSQSVRPFGRSETLYRVSETAVTYLPNQTALVTFASCSGG